LHKAVLILDVLYVQFVFLTFCLCLHVPLLQFDVPGIQRVKPFLHMLKPLLDILQGLLQPQILRFLLAESFQRQVVPVGQK
jgi:hypothetical protein